jgi:hypothetical protein
LWLRVENNNKYIRGKKKVRREIEDRVLSRYQMKKDRPDGWDYELSIPYETDEDLDAAIYDDILHEATWIAEEAQTQHSCYEGQSSESQAVTLGR